MNAILHIDKEWGIGKKNGLMFSLPKDMNFFKQTTIGKIVCMGYNTLLSFSGSKPLKNRLNVVLCEEGIAVDGCVCVHSVEDLLHEIKKYPPDDVFIIGGASVYRTMLPFCDKIYVTKVNAIGGADVFFPNLDLLSDFEIIHKSEPLIDNGFEIEFLTYKNNNVSNY